MKRILATAAILFAMTHIAAADFNSGLKAYNAGNYKAAQADWLAAGMSGDANAQLNLGVLYEKGVSGVKKNTVEALAWYRLAAAQNITAGKEGIARLKPTMSNPEIEQAEDRAVEILGRWFRKNIGRNETEYKAARKKLEQRKQEKLAREKATSNARADRQRKLIAQRDADAKLADQLEKESKAAAIKAAQEHAEEAKRQALIRQRREEEEKRIALLKETQSKENKSTAARLRLAELKRKSQTGSVSDATINQQIVASQKSLPEAKSQTQKTTIAAVTKPSTGSSTQASTTRRAAVATEELPKKPETDNKIVSMIFDDAKSADLENATAKAEIKSGQANIEALKWTLISAARGDATSVRMSNVFKREMTPVQIAESSRRAAIWISKRKQ